MQKATNNLVIEKPTTRVLEAVRAENSRGQQASFAYHVINRARSQSDIPSCSVDRSNSCGIENDLRLNPGLLELPMETGPAHGL